MNLLLQGRQKGVLSNEGAFLLCMARKLYSEGLDLRPPSAFIIKSRLHHKRIVAMHVSDILAQKGVTIITIHDDALLTTAIDILRSKKIGALVVINAANQVVGLLSERDIVWTLADAGSTALLAHVRDVMTEHVFTCRPEDSIKEISAWMTRHRVRHLPVVRGGELAGLVSIGDVVKHRLDEIETEASILRDLFIASH